MMLLMGTPVALEQVERAEKARVQLPPFVRNGRQVSCEQQFFVLAQAANVFDLIEHVLHFFASLQTLPTVMMPSTRGFPCHMTVNSLDAVFDETHIAHIPGKSDQCEDHI